MLLLTTGSFIQDTPATKSAARMRVSPAFPALTFAYPVDLTHANDGSKRLFVVEQQGFVKVFENKRDVATAQEFLNIRSKVSYGGEAGLLGLAFHPDFKTNGYYFLNYTRKTPQRLETVIARYKVDAANINRTDAASETILLAFEQPYDNHNGGSIKFGPDGYLYIATGDGGSWGDPSDNGQNKSAWLGKILRIDVNSTEKGHYGIPADNPFRGNQEGFREEVYAYGLRNPWRISFDPETSTLWAGDVGQNKREEIDVIVKGGNYGWRRKESIDCYKPARDCADPAFIDPILDMPQANGERSITGGFVYRGKKHPSLRGKYIFGDYVSGRVFALETKNGKAVQHEVLADQVGQISSFGVDEENELYICNHGTGKILTLVQQ
ncbi:PQQ-dependent sugar dehydrogenase [Rhabdobacter roseus]